MKTRKNPNKLNTAMYGSIPSKTMKKTRPVKPATQNIPGLLDINLFKLRIKLKPTVPINLVI